MTGRSWPLSVILLYLSLIGLCVSQTPSCDSLGFPATVRIRLGTSNYDSDIDGVLGNPLTLTCEVVLSGSNPPPIGSYTWEHNGQIINIDTRETLTIAMLGSSDGGVYHCRATATNSQCQTQYSNGRAVNTPPTITSLPLSTINILEGQSLQISCEADGYPEPTYEWYKTSDPSIILSNRTMYSVQAATVATSGVYVCRPRNRQGFGSEGRVTVVVSPLPTTTATLDTTEPLTTTMATKEEVTTNGNITSDPESDTEASTGSTGLYIGIGVISAVSVICALLTFICFAGWLYSSCKKSKLASNYEGEEMEMEYQEEAFNETEAVLETAVPIETVDTNEAVIPQPNKKKTRGKRRKF